MAVSLAVGLEGCTAAMRRAPSLSDSLFAVSRLDGVVEDYWRFLRVSRPQITARAGAIVTRLPDPTQFRAKSDAQFARAALAALDEILVDALPEDSYVTWASLRWEMEAMAGWTAFHWTRLDDLSPANSVFDQTIEILRTVGVGDPVAAQRFVDLVASVGDLARALQVDYAERARRDIRLPQPIAMRAIAHVRGLIAPPESSPFGFPADFRASADTAWQSQYVREVVNVIARRVNPALDSLARLLERERDRASDTLGLSRLPGGAAHYATLLRYRSTLDVSPVDAHAIGLREVARIAASAATARRDAGLPVNRDSLRAALKRDSAFQLYERSSIPERAARLFERTARELEPFFHPVPTMSLSIGLMPFGSAVSSPLAFYQWPTSEQPAARYLLNVAQLEARSALVLPGLVVGDLMPGLHFQQGIQIENTQLPAFRRLANHDGFVRGWQSYVLEVADSLSRTLTPWERFGLRLRDLAAACGLVVDTGINALGWTRADALVFLRAYLPDDDEVLEREIVFPAAELPGTLSAATLGARELRGMHRWAQRELGDRFSLTAFHNEVLRVGSVPLPVLGSHLERWIWEQNHALAPPFAGTR
ncbi:MAG TPA: DUF885 domain-containing protein [Gemmatimonadaceae bacterium]